jgi:uncharacterized pyridoxamine 5'-phosphate oxidase family protein
MITMEELRDKIGGVFYFATVENGAPRVRPFGFSMVFEDRLYFGCGTHKAAYAQMLETPEVELCAFNKGAFVRIRGRAVMDDRPEVQAAMYEAGPFLKETYNAETGHYHMCFYLENMSAMEFRGPDAVRLI